MAYRPNFRTWYDYLAAGETQACQFVFPGQEIPEFESFTGQMSIHDLLAWQGNLDKYVDYFTVRVGQHWEGLKFVAI